MDSNEELQAGRERMIELIEEHEPDTFLLAVDEEGGPRVIAGQSSESELNLETLLGKEIEVLTKIVDMHWIELIDASLNAASPFFGGEVKRRP